MRRTKRFDADRSCRGSSTRRRLQIDEQPRRITLANPELERRIEENGALFDEMKTTYNATVKAFAAAIDCKDKYTEGHSVRVGRLAEIIAAELGWGKDETEGAAVAGYLHDVGKLTVERRIINAPYRINAKQSAELNKHPTVGYEILRPIHHPFADVPLAAKCHHERVDGRGYCRRGGCR